MSVYKFLLDTPELFVRETRTRVGRNIIFSKFCNLVAKVMCYYLKQLHLYSHKSVIKKLYYFMIFISYAKENSERASRIYSILSKNDRPVFYDKESLVPGMDWKLEIEEKLNRCSIILILCSINSINKEGFIQKEIRMALERAEYMPEGRIFIIPVKFDNVTLSQKLSKYQWLEINNENNYFDLGFFIDIIWSKISESQTVLNQTNTHNQSPSFNKDFFSEKVVILIEGANVGGQHTYAYLELSIKKIHELFRDMRKEVPITLVNYGIVLEQGRGEVPLETLEKMKRKHKLIEVPVPVEKNKQIIGKEYEDYMLGFYEAYKTILGENISLPLVKPPSQIPEKVNAIRLGLKDGLQAAQLILKNI